MGDIPGGALIAFCVPLKQMSLARSAHVFGIDRLAVRRFDFGDFCRRVRRNHRHAVGKYAIDADDGFVASLQCVHYRRFNSSGAGSGERHGNAIFRLKNLPQQHLRIVHAALEPRVHVADQGRSQRAVHARVHRRRTRSKHKPIGRSKFPDRLSIDALRHENVPLCAAVSPCSGAALSPAEPREGCASTGPHSNWQCL